MTEDIVNAKQFNLLDENGKVRACLGMQNGPKLVFFDEDGKNRAELTVPKDGPRLDFSDENGKLRAYLRVSKDGPVLLFGDENSKPCAYLRVSKDGPRLALFDASGKPRAYLRVSKDGPVLELGDEKGLRAGLGAAQITAPDGVVVTYPESSLVLVGPDGKVQWRAPL
jgi:hypothetical protein